MERGMKHPVKIWDGVRGHVYRIPVFIAGAENKLFPVSVPLDIRRIPTTGNMENVTHRYPKPPNLPRVRPPPFTYKIEQAEIREPEEDDEMNGMLLLTTANALEWDDPWLGPHENDFRRLWSDDITANGIREGEGRNEWGLDWAEYLCERQFDQEGRELYFIFNISPSAQPLKINGALIDQGTIAGPLPPFAVIQTAGDHVGFWWGVGGSRYVPGQPPKPRRFLYPGEPVPVGPQADPADQPAEDPYIARYSQIPSPPEIRVGEGSSRLKQKRMSKPERKSTSRRVSSASSSTRSTTPTVSGDRSWKKRTLAEMTTLPPGWESYTRKPATSPAPQLYRILRSAATAAKLSKEHDSADVPTAGAPARRDHLMRDAVRSHLATILEGQDAMSRIRDEAVGVRNAAQGVAARQVLFGQPL
jgi:hypothetical protein